MTNEDTLPNKSMAACDPRNPGPCWISIPILLLGALVCLCGSPTLAASYSIDWFTVDGGGGVSSNGSISLTGTIGQPDAGTMSGGGYTLQGGFWGIVGAVQTLGAPTLTVSRTNTNKVIVSWSLPGSDWNLQATTSLSTTPVVWNNISQPYETNGISIYLIEPVPSGNKFYRLHKP